MFNSQQSQDRMVYRDTFHSRMFLILKVVKVLSAVYFWEFETFQNLCNYLFSMYNLQDRSNIPAENCSSNEWTMLVFVVFSSLSGEDVLTDGLYSRMF